MNLFLSGPNRPQLRTVSFFFDATRRLIMAGLALGLCLLGGIAARAATVTGTVTDSLGAAIPNAQVQLLLDGKVVSVVNCGPDGTYTFTTDSVARYTVRAAAQGFAVTTSETFFADSVGIVKRTLVLTPARVEQQVVVTATGMPTPLTQVSSWVTQLLPADLQLPLLQDGMRQVPGVTVTQSGQYGGQTSLFIRGGTSTANKILVNGIAANDVGGRFDLSTVTASDMDSVEVYRGADSVLYGSDAAAGVVSMQTRQGKTVVPLFTYEGDGGNFATFHNEASAGGVFRQIDYFGAVSQLQSSNSIPRDEFHDITSAVNLGWNPISSVTTRLTLRNSVSATGVPNAYYFYGIADNAKQSDQDLYISGTVEDQTTERWHNLVRYGATRKREQYADYTQEGLVDPSGSGNTLGLPLTITGANGYSVTGQALLDYACFSDPCSTNQYVSNRDQLYAQSDYRFNPHTVALVGFRYENERGVSASSYATNVVGRANYDYTMQLSGDIKNRLFYSLGGGIQDNELFGVEGTPRVGLAYYAVRPGPGAFEGTKISFNFSKGVQEPDVASQAGGLNTLLATVPGGPAVITEANINPVGAQKARSYDGGIEQNLFGEKAVFRANYFHNEFGSQIEYFPTQSLTALGISQAVVSQLSAEGFYGGYVNTLDYRAQGAEVEIEGQVTRSLFARAGYTYVDAVVQRSFSSDALAPAMNLGISVGAYDPLIGARPFRRPPHTAFFEVSYTKRKFSAVLTGNIVSRADDSTFLSDANYGNTLLLPNRNLDPSYQKLNLGGSYQVRHWIGVYSQLENLLSEQRAGVLGYPALPFTFRSGLKFQLGGDKAH